MTQEVKKRIDQIRHGIVPEGYRKAGTDIIPSDWDKSPFRQLGVIASGLVDPQKQPYSEMQHIGPDCIEKDTGRIFETKSASELRLISGKFYFDSDSIVYSKIRPNLNKVCAPPFEGICSADCYSIKPTGKIEKAYLFNLMLGYNFYKRAVACSMRTGMPKINQDDLNNIGISYPKSTTEQKKIAEILTTQDKVIVLERQKIEEIIKEKQFFLEKMFPKEGQTVPEIRFKGFTDPWEQRKLGEVGKCQSGIGFPDVEQGGKTGTPFFKVSDMNNYGNEQEMTCANNYVTDEQIVRKNWKPITEVPAVIFAKVGATIMLNRKRLCRFPFLLDNNTMAYKLGEQWDTNFGKTLFEKIDLTELVQVGALPSYNATDVENLDIKMPVDANEQKVIGEFFANLDNLITLHQRKLEEEKNKKKALMQLLLTGIVRV